ncbi:TRAP transporter large permease [Phaeovulum sp.]|uniref:TRAP transporter large permease n=1 Tax=Phaeovulum sp. TaxID=2934796 RepID=UPI002731F3B9|nr:TRAP transporter large permease [Phaeovulum sp.]MDP1669976.1 TRAP transporter large permease [Phaeovulum sp.]MDZ4118688.1 TRAP transporter large permease [Phaeovulum sp.]
MSLAFIVCLVAVFALAAIGTPIGYSLLVAATLYLAVDGADLALAAEQLIQSIYDGYTLLAVPLFIIAANIMNAGTVSERLLTFCVAVVGRFRGGMGHVNILSSLIFSGMSGSAVADAAGIGKIITEMMVKTGHYSRGYAAAVTAASATIGPIIPPSIPMVMYALISNQSIGYLFLAGILPGLLMGFMLMSMNYVISWHRDIPVEAPTPLRDAPGITIRAFPALMMPVILLSGIYGGATTPTEAAAIAALYALMLATGLYRTLRLREFYRVVVDSARQAATVGIVIGCALIFNYIVATERIPQMLSTYMADLDISPLMFLLAMNLLILGLGCLLDATTIILVVLPLFIPTANVLGIDLIHFGVVMVVNAMIGLITPPYGMLLFVINAVTGIPLRDIIVNVLPFLFALLLALVALTVFPDISLMIPRYFGYHG